MGVLVYTVSGQARLSHGGNECCGRGISSSYTDPQWSELQGQDSPENHENDGLEMALEYSVKLGATSLIGSKWQVPDSDDLDLTD